MRAAIDTNVLVYAAGVNSPEQREEATALIGRLVPSDVAVPVQVLGELFRVLVRKGGRTPARARATVMFWNDAFTTIGTTPDVMLQAIELVSDHQLDIWDAIILAAAASDGCRLLLSGDLQDGFTWAGVTVVNPFARDPHPLLGAALRGR